MIPKIQPCLIFNGTAEDAARFYADTFPDSRIDAIRRAPADFPGGRAGDLLTVEMTILGAPFLLLNAGPPVGFSMAVSYQVATADQAETDRYWQAITSNGGEESACGWCRDRFGLWWQITPRRLIEYMAAGDDTATKAFAAMMTMGRIDIAALERAVEGG
jgi:predicted 3-demethylubiquinone-9 3-methyltransferase (glyoxalase superfamily)